MRTNATSSLWFVPLAALAAVGCSPSSDFAPVAEETSAFNGEPNEEPVFRAPAPEFQMVPDPLTAVEVVSPELGPLASFPVVPADLGHLCRGGAECLSGHCYDGICCDSSCGGACEACDLPGTTGFCFPHPAGTDPEGCGASGCYGGMQEAFSCDGAGSCQVQVESCRAYACAETACYETCRTDDECAEGAHCAAESCVFE